MGLTHSPQTAYNSLTLKYDKQTFDILYFYFYTYLSLASSINILFFWFELLKFNVENKLS